MITLKESVFSNIPTEMRKKEVYILEGIRYSYGMIELSYRSLRNSLLTVSKAQKATDLDFYSIFKDAWAIIDINWRLRNIIFLLGQESENSKEIHNSPLDMTFFNKVRDFRNTLQHIDERISEVLIPEESYIWGTLSWLYFEKNNSKQCLSITLAPGHPRGKFNAINPVGKLITNETSHITLSSFNRKKEKIEINITDLYSQINQLLFNMDMVLRPQIEKMNLNKRFGQDLMNTIILESKNNPS